jgi:RpiB/LacA/LacB family sugar-phosphate isomerase
MKPTIVIPIAGKGARFPKEQWIVPKPLVLIDDKSIIEWSVECVDYTDCNMIFVVRQDHIDEFSIDDFLKKKFGDSVKVVATKNVTRGSVETVLCARGEIDPDSPLIIHCSDVFFEPRFYPKQFECNDHGCILTFKSNSPNYSYSSINENGKITEVVEKKVISNHASVGIYFFKQGRYFLEAADVMIRTNATTNGEFFVAPLYNLLILKGMDISFLEVEKMHIFGTPEEYDFFIKNTLKTIKKGTVALCSDHSGINAKAIFKKILEERGIKYIDFGCFNSKDTDYSPYVAVACKAILEGKCGFGVGFCRSGQGVNISANKIRGIRAAWVNNPWMAEMAIRHNCANFLSISEKFNDEESMRGILSKYLENTFDGGRHQSRLMQNEY